MLDFYGDNAFGRFIAATTGPAMAVGSLFGSFGEYTTVYRDKYDADNAGAEVGDALSDAPDRPARAVEGLLGGPRLSTYARRLTGERAEPVVVERASTGEGAAAPRSSSGGDEPAAAPAGGSHAGLVGALGN